MSLKEQMLKAGLIDEAQAKRGGHQKRQKDKKTTHAEREGKARAAREEAEGHANAEQARDREVNRERDAERKTSGEQARGKQQRENIRQTVFRQGALENWDGPKRYHFTEGGRVEFIQVSDTVARKLEQGQAAIARRPSSGQQYQLITRQAAEQLREAAPELLIVLHE